MIEIDGESWLEQNEVLALLGGISAATWRAVRRNGRGPQDGLVYLGRRVYMRRSSIRDWLIECGGSTDLTPEVVTPAQAVTPAGAGRQRGGVPVARQHSRSPFAGIGEAVDMGPR